MKKLAITRGLSTLALGWLLTAAAGSMASGANAPIALTAGSYTQDMVVEAGAVNDGTTHYLTNVTATMDGGTGKGGDTYYELGLGASASGTGLPAAGTYTSAADANTTFTLQSYTGNNALLLDAATSTGTLTLVTPGTYSLLSFFTASGNGANAVTVTATLHFADFSPDVTGLAISAPDWFGATPIAVSTGARVTPANGTFNSPAPPGPNIYQENLVLTGAALHPISSIDLSWSQVGDNPNGHTPIFGLSGTLVPEPSSVVLFGIGALGLLVAARRRRK